MRTATHAHGPLDGLTAIAVRVLVVAAVVLVVGVGHLVAHDVRAPAAVLDPPAVGVPDGGPVWRESYSLRFPGCVAAVLWPPDESPRGFVVRERRGGLEEISVHEAVLRIHRGGPAPRWRTVGVCR
jgi:hypothetical protein